jgi:hypothetical protein
METSASFEARYAPLPYPTRKPGRFLLCLFEGTSSKKLNESGEPVHSAAESKNHFRPVANSLSRERPFACDGFEKFSY